MSKKYSYQMTLEIVQEYFEGSLGTQLLAQKHHISNRSLIHKWVNQYKKNGKEGAEGLNKPQGRPSQMPKPNKNQKPSNDKNEKKNQVSDELELLKKENEYLRIELEFLFLHILHQNDQVLSRKKGEAFREFKFFE